MAQSALRDVRNVDFQHSTSRAKSSSLSFTLLRGSMGLLSLFLLVGCNKSSFVGKRFDNFTAYYNKFYNAERAYREGEKGIVQDDQAINRELYIQIFVTPERPGNATSFNDAIKKSADVLRAHPDSKWADDAALLIGQSYFYLQNYVGAEQKFREVMELSGGLEDEARFWLARSMIASGVYEEANEHLLTSLNRDGLTKRWAPMLRLALAELHVRRQDWAAAAVELEQAVDRVSNREFGARAQFLLGQVMETLGRYEDAVLAFKRVERFKPLYELSYAAKYSAVRVEGIYVDPERALKSLRSMERDDNNFSYSAQLDFLKGRIYQAAGQIYDAEDEYYELLYDEDAPTNVSSISGRIHYALGELYRDAFEDFVLAAAHFDTASTSLRRPTSVRGLGGATTSAAEIAYTNEAISDAAEIAEVFDEFATVHDQVYTRDSLLYLGSLDQETFDAKILEFREQLAEQQRLEREALERRQRERAFAGGVSASNAAQRNPGGGGQKNTSSRTGGVDGSDTGFLNHKDRIRMQEAQASFVEEWGERPLVPNWRRLEAISAADAIGEGEEGGGFSFTSIGEGDGDELPNIDISPVPRDSSSQAEMRAERALSRYELANVLFLSMNRADSAAVWYRMVIDEDNDQPVAQRAFFALAELQRSLGDSLAAEQLYRQVLDDYPDSDFAEEVRTRLGLEPAEIVVADSLILAQGAYEEAYEKWQSGALEEALDNMFDIGLYYDKTDVAPQAFLAAGSIYTELAVRDSLDIFGDIPIEAPDSLLIARGLVEIIEVAPPVDSLALASPDSVSAIGTLATHSDSLAVTADSLMSPVSDSLASVSDSLTVAVRDTINTLTREDVVPLDSASTAVDSKVADKEGDPVVEEEEALSATDSLLVTTDSLQVLPDSLQVDEAVQLASVEAGPLLLETLYGNISRSYQQTPYAEQAAVMLKALDSYRSDMEALADSLERMALADSLGVSYDSLDIALAAADSLAAPDSLATPLASDSLQTTTDPERLAELDEERFGEGREEARPRAVENFGEEEDEGELERPQPVETRTISDDGPRDGRDEAIDSSEIKPELIGTLEQLMALVRYPETARADSVEGDLTVDFTVNTQGNAVFPVVKGELGGGLEEEALRVLKLARFKVGTVRGNPVGMRMSLTLPFRIPPPEPEGEEKQ